MNEVERTNELLKKYPDIKPICGVWIFNGWVDLVISLVDELQKIEGWKNSYITQIKDKFGGLRFYYDLPAEFDSVKATNIKNMVLDAENVSYDTCPICGSRGTIPDKMSKYMRKACAEHLTAF